GAPLQEPGDYGWAHRLRLVRRGPDLAGCAPSVGRRACPGGNAMKAIRFHEFGGPEVLRYEDVAVPEPAVGEVLVRVFAAGVNPIDWKARAGLLRDWLPQPLPLVPGWDFSGTVERLGPGVSGSAVGDEVFGRADVTKDGAYAEYLVVGAGAV